MITTEQIKKANDDLRVIDIKGKAYVQVNERIKKFREIFPDFTITTSIISLENGFVTMQAQIKDETGRLIATGYAHEKETSSFINKTSFVENCETSAVGRALAFFGIGVDASMASAEEVANAILRQNGLKLKEATPQYITDDMYTELEDLMNEANIDGKVFEYNMKCELSKLPYDKYKLAKGMLLKTIEKNKKE